MNILDRLTLNAFLQALSQQPTLPDGLQQDLMEVGYDLAKRQPDAIEQLRQIIQHYPSLNRDYDRAYRHLQTQYQTQERTKGWNDSAVLTWDTDLLDSVTQVLLADQPIQVADRWLKRLNAANPNSARSTLVERGNRLLALTAGGAALGGAIAQLPGAIIGGIFAALFAWFSFSPTPTEKVR